MGQFEGVDNPGMLACGQALSFTHARRSHMPAGMFCPAPLVHTFRFHTLPWSPPAGAGYEGMHAVGCGSGDVRCARRAT
eukprot:65282-Chlamydomonas_euryale.AAC.1